MHHYAHHIGDYRRDTAHLTLLEHGIYRQLLDTYYLDETPIPNSFPAVCRRLSARTDEEQLAVRTVIKEFFTLRDGAWHHSRCDDVIAAYKHRQEVNSANGKQGGRGKKKQDESDSVATGKATKNQKPRTSKGATPPIPPQLGEWFDAWWGIYPLKVAKQEALKAFIRVLPDQALFEQICAALRRQIELRHFDNLSGVSNPPHPATWLNGQRWTDDVHARAAAPFPSHPASYDRRAASAATIAGLTNPGDSHGRDDRTVDVDAIVVVG